MQLNETTIKDETAMKTNVQEISSAINVSYTPTIIASLKRHIDDNKPPFSEIFRNNINHLKSSALRVLNTKPYLNSFIFVVLISIALTILSSPIWKL